MDNMDDKEGSATKFNATTRRREQRGGVEDGHERQL